MSLVANISAVVTQIGTTIKSLTARVSALESLSANVQTGNYTLVAGDSAKEVQINSATAATVTVDPSVLTVGAYYLIRQAGAGQVTLAGTGLTAGGPTLKSAQQGALLYVRCDSSSAAYAGGEVAAS